MKTKYLWVVVMLVTMVQPAVCQTFDSITREQIRKDMEEMKAMQEKERREVVEELRNSGIRELRSLSFSTSGSIINSGVYYELTSDDGKYAVKIKLDGQSNGEAKKYLISDEQVKELIKLFNQYEVWQWDGFNEHNPNVLDGSSFYFTLNIQDGKKIDASGYMMYPENYREVIPEMLRIIDEGKGEVIEEEEAAPVPITVEKIDNLLYAYSDFTDYDNALYSFGGHKVITVHSGDGLPENKEEHSISDEQVEELIDVFNKYEVWRWNGFNKDTIGEGSFSFILFVQDGITIEAEGHGIYPENFWEVIQELNRILDEGKEDNCILDEDDEEEEASEEEGDNGVLVPIIIGAGALVVVLVVIGVVRKRTARQAR